ncbi:MAG: 2-oxo-4-hydroxy-4-carboxy-5-ureidoimidazoline decarboxylase, partial [Pseudomonadota bacterium]
DRLNKQYMIKHKFPFIIAVLDNAKEGIMEAFHKRIDNNSSVEFATACKQVERIAQLRLQTLFAEQ